MSTPRKAEYADASITDDAVHDYLIQNPDFFDRHPDLLSTLRLLLNSLLDHNSANIETVAEFGGISTRTLQRRLAD